MPPMLLRCLPLLTLCLFLEACGMGRVHRLTDTAYPPKGPQAEIDLFIGKLTRPYEPIALADSARYTGKEGPDKERMLEDLRRQARRLGGDAVHDIRLLPVRIRGIVADEGVPIPGAWTQGGKTRYFLRGEVLRYVGGFGEAPPEEPEKAEAPLPGSRKRPSIADPPDAEPATAESLRVWSLDEGE